MAGTISCLLNRLSRVNTEVQPQSETPSLSTGAAVAMGATSSRPPCQSLQPLCLSSGRPAFPRDSTLFRWHYLPGKAATASDALFEGNNTTAAVFAAAPRDHSE